MKKKVTIDVPVCWGDVSVHKYQALQSLKKDDYKSDMHYAVDMISILCGVNANVLDAETFTTISNELVFLSEAISTEKIEEIKIGDDTYKWIGSFNQITVGEMLSIEQVIDLEELTYSQAFDVIAAVLLRKVKPNGELSKFNVNKFNSDREMFSELPVDQLHGMINFFIAGGKICTVHSVDYLVRLMSIPTSTQKKSWLLRRLYNLKKVVSPLINGWHLLTNSLTKILLRMKKSTN